MGQDRRGRQHSARWGGKKFLYGSMKPSFAPGSSQRPGDAESVPGLRVPPQRISQVINAYERCAEDRLGRRPAQLRGDVGRACARVGNRYRRQAVAWSAAPPRESSEFQPQTLRRYVKVRCRFL